MIKNGRNKGLTGGDVAAGPFIGCLGGRYAAVCWSNESREDNAINFKTRAAPSKEKGEEKEPRRYPRGFAQRRGHVCIIRDKPITARNACQAVKRYPGQQPGGLMISLGNLLDCHPRPSFRAFLVHSPRIITALIVTHYYHYYYQAYNFIPPRMLPIREDLIITNDDDRWDSWIFRSRIYFVPWSSSIRILCRGGGLVWSQLRQINRN